MKEHDKTLGRRSRRLSSNSPASIRRLTLLAASVTFLAGPAAYAQDAYKAPPRATAVAPERRQNSELSDELAAIGGSRPSADAYIVDGIRPIEGGGIFTRRLVFKAGAKLVIVRGRSGGPVRIRADEVVIEGPGAGIFWSRPPAPSTTPSDRGKAPSGTFGRAPGANGGNGLDGEPGNPGFAGSDAVDLVLAFREIAGSDLDVDLRGSDGGPGGRGQDGGEGGAGSQGGSAIGSFFGCKSGPGRGGDGGAGGSAGAGGPGGPGGRGGTLIVMTPDIDDAGRIVHAYVGAGANGPAGRPGLPGSGGEPGPEGPLAPPFCTSANRHGNRGSDGIGQASNIPPTAASTTGGFALVPFSPELSAQIFGPPQTP